MKQVANASTTKTTTTSAHTHVVDNGERAVQGSQACMHRFSNRIGQLLATFNFIE
jgi:hypothetical protein